MAQTKQVEQLKLNVTNIHSFLVKENKRKEKLSAKKEDNKKRKISFQKKQQKEKQLEANKAAKSEKNAGEQVIKTSSMSLLDKLFNFGGLLLGGILVNAADEIVKEGKKFYADNKELFDTIGRFLNGVKDAAVGLFNSFTGPYSEEGAFDDFAKFDDSGKLQSGTLKKVEDAYNDFGDLINKIDKAMGGKGTAGNFLKTDTTPSREELVKQTERGSGMASFREDAAENAELQKSVRGDGRKDIPVSPSREELVKQTERGSGMASFREDATENAELQKSARGDGREDATENTELQKSARGDSRKDIPVSPGGSFSEGALISALDAVGYTNKKERAMFLAQMAHESGNFRYDEEIWGPTDAQKGYEGRSDLGNNQPGDGYKYRGRGYIQLTGRANYRQYGKLLGVDLENNPDLAKDPNIAARVAIEYWKKRVNRTAAQKGDVKTVTYNINGGYNGLTDRIEKYKKYLKKSNTQPKITPVPDKGDKTKVLNQPDPRKNRRGRTVAVQRVNTIQTALVPMPIPMKSSPSSVSQPQLPSIWST